MKAHRLCDDTVQRLSAAKTTTWRGLAQHLGYAPNYAATLCKAARNAPGAMTAEAENVLRLRLGLAPVHHVEVPPCPDCGAVHTGRCHGREVKVVPVGKPRARRRYFRPCLPVELRGAYEQWRSEQDGKS